MARRPTSYTVSIVFEMSDGTVKRWDELPEEEIYKNCTRRAYQALANERQLGVTIESVAI